MWLAERHAHLIYRATCNAKDIEPVSTPLTLVCGDDENCLSLSGAAVRMCGTLAYALDESDRDTTLFPISTFDTRVVAAVIEPLEALATVGGAACDSALKSLQTNALAGLLECVLFLGCDALEERVTSHLAARAGQLDSPDAVRVAFGIDPGPNWSMHDRAAASWEPLFAHGTPEHSADATWSEGLDEGYLGTAGASHAFLRCCSASTLRKLKAVSHVWLERVRAILCSSAWRLRQVRAHDRCLALEDLSWAELTELLRALRDDGVAVEAMRCGLFEEQATISFAPLVHVSVHRVTDKHLRRCVSGPAGTSAPTLRRLVRASALCVLLWCTGLTSLVLWEREALDLPARARRADRGHAFALALGATVAATTALVNLTIDGSTIPIKRLTGTHPVHALDLARRRIGAASTCVIAKCLEVNGALTQLDLSENELCGVVLHADTDNLDMGANTSDGIAAIANALRVNGALTHLSLRSNGVDGEGAAAIADALRVNGVNGALTSLDISGDVGSTNYKGIGPQGAEAIANALRVNGRLTSLHLYRNSIADVGAAAIADALRTSNRTLTRLDIGDNLIGNQGAVVIADALRVNRTLTTLELGDNSIENKGAMTIADALRVNDALTSLELSDNFLTEEGALGIVRAVRHQDKMLSLHLTRCGVGTSGAQEIAEYVRVSGLLRSLNLDGQPIPINQLKGTAPVGTLDLSDKGFGDASAIVIAKCIEVNGVLTSLDLSSNYIKFRGTKAIADALRANDALTFLDLHDNRIIGREAGTAIGDALRVNGALTELNLSGNELCGINRFSGKGTYAAEGIEAIADALRINGALTVLDLQRNELREDAIRALNGANATRATAVRLLI